MNIQDKLEYFRKKVVEQPEHREALIFAVEFMVNPGWQKIYMHKVIWEGGSHGHYVEGYTPKPEQLEISAPEEENPLVEQWEALQNKNSPVTES